MNKAQTGFRRYNQRITAVLIAALFILPGLLGTFFGKGGGLFSKTAYAAEVVAGPGGGGGGDVQDGQTTYDAVGAGTDVDPWLIGNAVQLRDLARVVNEDQQTLEDKYIEMTADIDLSDYGAAFNNGEGWDPIGNAYGGIFSGNFDGGGFEVSNLYINATTSHDASIYVGLFGYVSDGSIKNLGVSGSVTATADAEAAFVVVAGIVAVMESTRRDVEEHILGSITDCYNAAAISVSAGGTGSMSAYGDEADLSVMLFAGGIATILDNISVTNCYNAGAVSAHGDAVMTASGITTMGDYNTVEKCFNMGAISASSSLVDVDGSAVNVAGINAGGNISVINCYNSGSVSASAASGTVYAGGVRAVFGNKVQFDSCYNSGSVSATGSSDVYAGGIIAFVSISQGDFNDCLSNCFFNKEVFNGDAIGGYFFSDQYPDDFLSEAGLTTAQMTAPDALEAAGPMSALGGAYSRRLGYYYPELLVFYISANPTISETSRISASPVALAYTITYENVNGASNSNPTEYIYGTAFDLVALGAREGYIFGGWYATADFSGAAVTGILQNSVGDKTFWAKWTEDNPEAPGNDWLIPVIIATAGVLVIAGAAVFVVKNKKKA